MEPQLNGGYCAETRRRRTTATTRLLLVVISSCGHLKKLSMWMQAIHMTCYLFPDADVESRISPHFSCPPGPRVNWMDGCVEMLITAGGWLGEEGSKDDLMAGRIIAPSLLLSAEAGISSSVSRRWAQGLFGEWITALQLPVSGIKSYYSSKAANF